MESSRWREATPEERDIIRARSGHTPDPNWRSAWLRVTRSGVVLASVHHVVILGRTWALWEVWSPICTGITGSHRSGMIAADSRLRWLGFAP